MTDATPSRSTFVTVVAWVFIVLSGFSTAIGVLQNLMLALMFRDQDTAQAMRDAPPDAPAFAVFMTEHIHWFFAAMLLVSAATLASSIGLLRRRNWARLCFVALMLLGIAWNLAGFVLQLGMMGAFREQFAQMQAQGGPDMQPFLIVMLAISALFALGFSVLFGWIARRLLSPVIVAEFREQN